MNLDVSTVNLLLGFVITLQCWAVAQIYKLKGKVSNLQLRFDLHEDKHTTNHHIPCEH